MAIGDKYGLDKSVSGWSTTGKVFVPGTGIAVQGDKGFGLQASFPKAGIYTVQFSKRLSANQQIRVGAGAVFRAQALVTFTVEGNSTTRRIDINEGTSISGTCQSINVEVYNFFSQNGIGIDDEFDVSITVTPGTRAQSGSPPIASVNRFILGIPSAVVPILFGTTEFVDVPPDAGCNAVFLTAVPPIGTPFAANSADLVISQEAGHAGPVLATANLDGINRWWPFVPGASCLALRNTMAAGTVNCTVLLGIQG